MFTVRARSPSSFPLNMLMAFSASDCVLISTKAKPLDRPVSLSVIKEMDFTDPAWEKRDCRSPSPVEYDKLPTYSLLSMLTCPDPLDLGVGRFPRLLGEPVRRRRPI